MQSRALALNRQLFAPGSRRPQARAPISAPCFILLAQMKNIVIAIGVGFWP
jgi:hypothetical protein